MARITVDVPYFAWRDGRPRWVPGPKLRALGWKGKDLKDEAGRWLGLELAKAAAAGLNVEVAAAGDRRRPKPFRPVPKGRAVDDLLEAYFASPAFRRLAPSTQQDYRNKAVAMRWRPRSRVAAAKNAPRQAEPFAAAPVRLLGAPEVKQFFEYLVEVRGLTMARGTIAGVLSAAYEWGRLSPEWRLTVNPCLRLDLPKPAPRVRVASDAEIRGLLAAADATGQPSLGDALYLGLFTGQRERDLLVLADRGANRGIAERASAGEPITFVQRKTGARVKVFPAPQLVARLAAAEARRRALAIVPQEILVCETTGAAWGQSHFQHEFAKLRSLAAAGDAAKGLAACPSVASLNFQDLRDTAITWLARAGCTIPEIASISGHSLKSIYNTLKHYLDLDEAIAKEAIRKLVDWIDREGMRL